LQIGLVNKSSDAGGTQIGLINIATKSRGTQIGLINISREREKTDRATGILNTGTYDGSIRITTDPLLPSSFSISHGTSYWQNEWIFGYAAVAISDQHPKFKYGYSYERTKMFYPCGNCPETKITAWGFGIDNYRFTDKSKNWNASAYLKIQKSWLIKKGFFFMMGAKGGIIWSTTKYPLQIHYYKTEKTNFGYNINILPYVGILYR